MYPFVVPLITVLIVIMIIILIIAINTQRLTPLPSSAPLLLQSNHHQNCVPPLPLKKLREVFKAALFHV